MAKLIHKGKTILKDMLYLKSIAQISKGLMFASKEKIKKGACLVIPAKEKKYGSSVTMFFCFSSMQILFVNEKYEVVDKTTLKPWTPSYTPKKKAKYVIESLPKTFDKIELGDKVKIELN